MSGQYWFPSMSHEEIVDSFGEWGIPINMNDLRRPTPDFVAAIYLACLQQVTTLSADALHAPIHQALAQLDSTDLYAAALAHNFLLHHLSVSPSPSSHPRSPPPDSDSQRQQRAKLAEDEPRCDELRKENDQLTEYLMNCRERQMGLLETVKSLKQERSGLTQRKESLHATIEGTHEAISRTRTRIVQSPDRIKDDIRTMGESAAEEKRTVAVHEAKIRDLQSKVTALVAIEKDVRSCVEQLQGIDKEVQALDELKKNLADLSDQLTEKRGERNDLLLKRERVHKQHSNALEKLDRAQKHAEDKRLASAHTLNRLQHEYEEMSVERADNDRHVEELRHQADEVEKRMGDHMRVSQAELNELLTEYWKLRYATDVYMETLANKLGMQVVAT
ncbi:hypothetical protein PHLCEN_2v2533 [Hermanssonia centrifuga]|uniref:Uncharacterized protein n=1 Tax=Hermanssonia centrifuga TaxID=98765 RepID=A0A2R6RLL1_9APHY|nr:hypothetical protein PHLCEN_2v2533 [Hermanssonia centrifuga]